MRDSEILRGAWSRTTIDERTEDWILSDGIRVRREDRGVFPDEGHIYWIRIYGAPSRHYARNVAERFGRITESDEAEDGAATFSIVLPGAVQT